MALWGTADRLYSVGSVTVNYAAKTITGSGTSFTAVGISTGDVITIGAGGTFGSAVISEITSDSLISVATTQYLSGANISNVSYALSEKPIFTLEDSGYSPALSDPEHVVYGVDKNEISAIGISTQYGGIHAGWVGIQTYIDMHGNLRVKSETLVAMSEISSGSVSYTSSGDAVDDEVFVDAIINIVGPESVEIESTEDAVFAVEVDVNPAYAPLTYQWQENNVGDLTDSMEYDGTTTPILTVSNNNDKDGKEYLVVVTSGDSVVLSGIASITYV